MKSPFRTRDAILHFLQDRKETIQGRIRTCQKYTNEFNRSNIEDWNSRVRVIKMHEDELEHIDMWIEKIKKD